MSLTKVAYDYAEHMEKEAVWGWLKKLLWDAPKAGIKAAKNAPQSAAKWANKNAKPAVTAGPDVPSGLLDASGKPIMTKSPDIENKLTAKNRLANIIQKPANQWGNKLEFDKQKKSYEPTVRTFDNIRNMPKVQKGWTPANKALAITAGGSGYVLGSEGVPNAINTYNEFQRNRRNQRESLYTTLKNQGTKETR